MFGCVCLSVCRSVCVSSKNTAVYCLTIQKALQSIFMMLGCAIPILRKIPTKLGESCVECYGHAFLIALLLIRTVDGNWV